jgi:hypothetical protein
LTSDIAQLYWEINLGYWDHDPLPLPVVRNDTTGCSPGSSSAFECERSTDLIDAGHPIPTLTCLASSVNDTSQVVEPYFCVETSNRQVRPCLLPGFPEPSAIIRPASLAQLFPLLTHTTSPFGRTISSISGVSNPQEIQDSQSPSLIPTFPSQLSCGICGGLFDDDVDSFMYVCPAFFYNPNLMHCSSHLVSWHKISSPFHCGTKACRTHKELRSLKRHLMSIHLRALYVCCCGHSSRKDKHCDHLRRNTWVGHSYRCNCGYINYDKSAHALHIDICGRRRSGRPKKQSNNKRKI